MLYQIFALTVKDLKILFRDRSGMIALFAMPMMFILVMSVALQGVFQVGSSDRPVEVTVNPAEFLYLMAQEYIAIAGGGPARADLQPISVLPLTVLQNRKVDPLTKLQFWTFNPAVFM